MDVNSNRCALLLKEIIDSVEHHNLPISSIGLHTGKSGLVLLYYYYGLYCNENIYSQRGWNMIQQIVNAINQGYNNHTFCDGIGGFCWTMEHLAQQNLISRRMMKFIDSLDVYLYNNMMNDISQGNYDLLHGAIGNGLYFLSRSTSTSNNKYIEDLIDEIGRVCEREMDSSIKWAMYYDYEKKYIGYNLGLAHGIPSIILFLSKAIRKGIKIEKSRQLMSGACQFIIKHVAQSEEKSSFSGNWVLNNRVTSDGRRISWCYGQIGVGLALYHAGRTTCNNYWIILGTNLLINSVYIRDINKERIIDSCICHGTSGLAHIYNRLYNDTANIIYKDAALFWLENTIKMSVFNDGIAGFKSWKGDNRGGWEIEYGLLEGVTGVGLTLLSFDLKIKPNWDECLLLS